MPPPVVPFAAGGGGAQDGRRQRAVVQRKAYDYNNLIMRHISMRTYYKRRRDWPALQNEVNFGIDVGAPTAMQNPAESAPTHFMHTSINKARHPVNAVVFTPDGRRLLTGLSSGEFTLWNSLTFHFEMIMMAHPLQPVRCLAWSPYDDWLVSGDNGGIIKYWLPNYNNVKELPAHVGESIRGLSFAPTGSMMASAADDNLVKVWDVATAAEMTILKGHGAEARCVDWHPVKGLIASGSRDNLVKLWDPRSGRNMSTFHYHKNAVLGCSWNRNGNWLATCSRDSQIIIFDVRQMQPLQIFTGHKKEVSSFTWHPVHETLLTSGGSDGSIMNWLVGTPAHISAMETAHESNVWSLAYHPLGHLLVSASNDHTTKYWSPNPPGDTMQDRYSLGTRYVGTAEAALLSEEAGESGPSVIPGMGSASSIPRAPVSMTRQFSREGAPSSAPQQHVSRGGRRFQMR